METIANPPNTLLIVPFGDWERLGAQSNQRGVGWPKTQKGTSRGEGEMESDT